MHLKARRSIIPSGAINFTIIALNMYGAFDELKFYCRLKKLNTVNANIGKMLLSASILTLIVERYVAFLWLFYGKHRFRVGRKKSLGAMIGWYSIHTFIACPPIYKRLKYCR